MSNSRTKSPERKVEVMTAVICLLVILVLTISTLLFWRFGTATQQSTAENTTQKEARILTQDTVANIYEYGGLVLTLRENGTAELNQSDWAEGLAGDWSIGEAQAVLVEIPTDETWRQRFFELKNNSLIDLQDGTVWKQQQ